jgi:hypothetical protein
MSGSIRRAMIASPDGPGPGLDPAHQKILDAAAHATISSADADTTGWSGAEVVYHERSHELVLDLQDKIEEEARAQGKRAGSLWHAVQFVMTGEVVRQALAARQIEFQPYVYRNNLIDGDWKPFRHRSSRSGCRT